MKLGVGYLARLGHAGGPTGVYEDQRIVLEDLAAGTTLRSAVGTTLNVAEDVATSTPPERSVSSSGDTCSLSSS